MAEDTITGAQGVARALVAMGVELVLGMPGGNTGAIYDALYDYRDQLRVLLVREESTGTAMAEAYGRLTGRPVVVMGQGAWVLTNAGAGIVEALLGSSPMIVLADFSEGGGFAHHAPYQSGAGHYGSFDMQRGFEAITKRTFVARDPVQAVQLTQMAYKHAMTGAPGPCAVVFDGAAVYGKIGPNARPAVHFDANYVVNANVLAPANRLDDAARAIRGAARPVILAGNGVRLAHAEAALRELAESADIPVATTAAGKSTIPEDHPLAAGVIGTFGTDTANALLGEADLVLAVGTRLSPSDLANETPKLLDPSRQVLVQVDVDPLNVSWTQPAAHALVGDAKETLLALHERLHEAHGGGAARVREARQQHGFDDHPDTAGSPLRARGAVQVLVEALPDDAIVTCDAGENRLFMLHDFRANAHRRFLQPNATGGMGYAIPAALGAKFAFPGSPVFAVCGDGGFAMTMHGLMTAIEEELPIAAIVLNNQALGWVYHGQGNRPIASEFAPFNHAAIASALGCHAARVSEADELRNAIGDALAAGKPAVIEVMTTRDDTYRDVIAKVARGG